MVALLTLALGIGGSTVMFTVVNGVLLRPLAYPDSDRLVSLHEQTGKYRTEWSFAYLNFLDCQRQSRTLTPMAAWRDDGGMVTIPGEAEYVSAARVSANLFSLLGIRLLRGRTFMVDEDRPGGPRVAIISYRLWQHRYGGSINALGERLVFDGTTYTVVGIAPADLRLSGNADVITPLGQDTDPAMTDREMHPDIYVLARVRHGITLAQVQADLAMISHHLAERYPKSNADRGFVARPLQQELVGDLRTRLWLLLGAVGLVLLMASVNIASLLLAQAVSRQREFAVRVALGAGRGRFVCQSLTESGVVGLCAATIGVLLALVAVRPFVMLWPGGLARADEVHVDWHAVVFAATASILSSLLFGLIPTLRVRLREPERALRTATVSPTPESRRLHCGLVVAEIALTVILLITDGILGRSVLRLFRVDPGFDRHVLVTRVALAPHTLETAATVRAAWQDILKRVRNLPGIQSAAVTDCVPMTGENYEIGYWTTPGTPPQNGMPLSVLTVVAPDYFRVMRIPLREGRLFDEHDRIGNEPTVVIDEVMARRAFSGRNPIGNWLSLQFLGSARVVGVVGHVQTWGLGIDNQAEMREQAYFPFAHLPDVFMPGVGSRMALVARTAVPPMSIVAAVRQELRAAARDEVLYSTDTMEQIVGATLAPKEFLLLLFSMFASLSLLLACIGIYGVLAYESSQRRAEIGIRMALGAKPHDMVCLVLRRSLAMILIGVALGTFASLVLGRLLARVAGGVQVADPLTFVVMISVLVIAALFASLFPAIRASRIDAMSAMRQQ